MSAPIDLKVVHIQELLSFHLFCRELPEQDVTGLFDAELTAAVWEENRNAWQALSVEARNEHRACGIAFLKELEATGLGVRVADNREVTKTIEFLLTVPPRIAYELPIPAKEPEIPTIVLPNTRPTV
jgi:hypothetical protein